MAKIITVYINSPRAIDQEAAAWVPSDMSYIRWFKISEALARLGHHVDMALPDDTLAWPVDSALLRGTSVGFIELSSVNWRAYDVVKTLFHDGMATLARYGGIDHPFIISKLGSVVGPCDMAGIYFHGEVRARLFALQEKIHRTSKYVTVLSQAAEQLFLDCHGPRGNLLLVPGGVDREIPSASEDPYPAGSWGRCIFAGHIYTKHSQPEANRALCAKLNKLGKLLDGRGVRLLMIGSGDVSALDERYVCYLGVVPYTKTWNYLQFADVGLVVSAGKFMHNNESSKIYHYLRCGLPVVTESGFPNDYLVKETELGYVTESEDLPLMAKKIANAVGRTWNSERAMAYILARHTWDQRVKTYEKIIQRELDAAPSSC